MPYRIRSFRRFVVLALPCWLLGGPLGTTLQVAACPHHDTMPSSMHQGSGSQAPCWCPNMAGSAIAELPPLAASAPDQAVAGYAAPVVTALGAPQSVALPSSPSFAPAPPPPNAIV